MMIKMMMTTMMSFNLGRTEKLGRTEDFSLRHVRFRITFTPLDERVIFFLNITETFFRALDITHTH